MDAARNGTGSPIVTGIGFHIRPARRAPVARVRAWNDAPLQNLNSRLALQTACRRFIAQLRADCPLAQSAMCFLRAGLPDKMGLDERAFIASLYTGTWDSERRETFAHGVLDFVDACMLAAIAMVRCTPRGLRGMVLHHTVEPQFLCVHARSLDRVVAKLTPVWTAAMADGTAGDRELATRAIDRALKNDNTLDGAILILHGLYTGG